MALERLAEYSKRSTHHQWILYSCMSAIQVIWRHVTFWRALGSGQRIHEHTVSALSRAYHAITQIYRGAFRDVCETYFAPILVGIVLQYAGATYGANVHALCMQAVLRTVSIFAEETRCIHTIFAVHILSGNRSSCATILKLLARSIFINPFHFLMNML